MARFNPHPVTQSGKPDKRYCIALEHCGHDRPRYVLRFCDEFIFSTISYSAAAMRAVGHNQARLGAAIVEAMEGARP